MAKNYIECPPYYSEDNGICYHIFEECLEGKKIKEENKSEGTNELELCEVCAKMLLE